MEINIRDIVKGILLLIQIACLIYSFSYMHNSATFNEKDFKKSNIAFGINILLCIIILIL